MSDSWIKYNDDANYEECNCKAVYVPSANKAIIPTGFSWGGEEQLSWVPNDNPTGNVWNQISKAPTGRDTCEPYDGAVSTYNGKVYIFGGQYYKVATVSDVYEYTPATDSWVTKASMPVTMQGHIAVTVGSKAYIIGVNKVVYIYDYNNNTWSTAPFTTTYARDAVVAEAFKYNGEDAIVVTGGRSGSTPMAKTEIIFPNRTSNNVVVLNADEPTPRWHSTSFVIGTYMYVVNGTADPNSDNHYNTVSAFDLTTLKWADSSLTLTPSPYASSRLAGFAVNGTGYIAFGWDGWFCRDFARYNPNVNPVSSITLNKSTDSINVGSSDTLVNTVYPTNATNKAVTWSSTNTSVATVNQGGVVTGISAGTCDIYCTSVENGNIVAKCTVTASVRVSSVSLDKTTLSLDSTKTAYLSANITPSNATNKSVTWSTSNASVATVDSNGKVTPVSVGTANITVTTSDGAKTATCAVTVFVASTSLTLDRTRLSLTKGASATINATINPSNTTNKTVTWSSSDPTIATVDSTGKVTAIKGGRCVITAKTNDTGLYNSCLVLSDAHVLTATTMASTQTGDWVEDDSVTYNGTASLRSATIPDNGVTTSTQVINIPTGATNVILSFKCIVDTECNKDLFTVALNGTQIVNLSGSIKTWTGVNIPSLVGIDTPPMVIGINAALVPGNNTLVFKYAKDSANSSGADKVYISDITYTYSI
jgi:uncharacterized protein YjdB